MADVRPLFDNCQVLQKWSVKIDIAALLALKLAINLQYNILSFVEFSIYFSQDTEELYML